MFHPANKKGTSVLVKMIVGISGSRHDDRPWPPPNATFEVPDWEGRDLIRGGNAVPANVAARRIYEDLEWGPADPGPADPAPPAGTQQLPGTPPATTAAPDPAPAPDSPADTNPDSEADKNGPYIPEMTPEQGFPGYAGETADGTGPEPADVPSADRAPVPVPGPSAPKQSWVDYAISQGAAETAASAMTKVDLMSKYGGRL